MDLLELYAFSHGGHQYFAKRDLVLYPLLEEMFETIAERFAREIMGYTLLEPVPLMLGAREGLYLVSGVSQVGGSVEEFARQKRLVIGGNI